MHSFQLLLAFAPLLRLVLAGPINSCQCPQVDCTARSTPSNCFCLNYCCAAEIGSSACNATMGPIPTSTNYTALSSAFIGTTSSASVKLNSTQTIALTTSAATLPSSSSLMGTEDMTDGFGKTKSKVEKSKTKTNNGKGKGKNQDDDDAVQTAL